MEPSKFERVYTTLVSLAPSLKMSGGIDKGLRWEQYRIYVLSRDDEQRPVQISLGLYNWVTCNNRASIEYEVLLSHEVGFAVADFRRKGETVDVVHQGTTMNAVKMSDLADALESWLLALETQNCRFVEV